MRLCGVKSAAAQYRRGDDVGSCKEEAVAKAKCAVCGWGSHPRCGRHAQIALAKHVGKKHSQVQFPYANEKAQGEDL